jgi:hypothetical protein
MNIAQKLEAERVAKRREQGIPECVIRPIKRKHDAMSRYRLRNSLSVAELAAKKILTQHTSRT